MSSITAKCGAILALAVSLLAAQVARLWNWNENVPNNILVLANPYMLPAVSPGMSLEEQILHLAKQTKAMEATMSESMVKFFGEAFHAASFGGTQTKLAELTIPNSKDNHKISVICHAPQDTGSSPLPLVLHFFGGGLVMGSPKAELTIERWISRETNAVVCSIGYRLAPQHPYPTPIEDAIDGSVGVLTTFTKQIEEDLGTRIDTTRIATFGLSAGGYISSHVARQLSERGYEVACQIALVPMVKPHGGTPSMIRHWNARTWSGFKNTYSWAVFLPNDDGSLASSYKVNLLILPPDQSHQPPAYIQIHTQDVLRDEGEMYAEKLKAIDRLIALDEFDTSHIGSLPGFSKGGPGQEAFPKALKVLNQYLHNTTIQTTP